MTALAYLYDVDERVGKKAQPMSIPLRSRPAYISEPPPSNDNRTGRPFVRAIEEVEETIDKKHALISELMHKRNESPHDELLKKRLDTAFEELEELEERRADLLVPYTTINAPSFSGEALRVIDKAERLWSEYEQSHSTENDAPAGTEDPKAT